MPPLDNDRRELFALYYVHGHPDPDTDTIGSATAAYQAAYGCKKSTARSNGSGLMKVERVRARVRELREERAEEALANAYDWGEKVPEMQQVVLDVAKGKYSHEDDGGRTRLRAAIHWLDRHYGTVREMHELQVKGTPIVVGVAGPPHQLEDDEGAQEGDGQPRAIEARSRELEGSEPDDGQEEEPGDLLDWFERAPLQG